MANDKFYKGRDPKKTNLDDLILEEESGKWIKDVNEILKDQQRTYEGTIGTPDSGKVEWIENINKILEEQQKKIQNLELEVYSHRRPFEREMLGESYFKDADGRTAKGFVLSSKVIEAYAIENIAQNEDKSYQEAKEYYHEDRHAPWKPRTIDSSEQKQVINLSALKENIQSVFSGIKNAIGLGGSKGREV